MSDPAQGNPFQNMSGKPATQVTATGRLKIAIVGKQKSGKTTLATTARKPMLFYDHDDRPESLAGKEDIHVVSKPTMLQIETDLSIMKANKKQGKPLPQTIVHDSMTMAQRCFEEEIFSQGGKDFYKEVVVGNSTRMKIRKGWDAINGIQQLVRYLIAEYTALGCDLIFIFHERYEKNTAESTPEKPAYTGDLTVDPQYMSFCLGLFNEVYHIKVDIIGKDKVKYTAECRPSLSGNWATTMELDREEEPDILGMISKHEQKRAALAKKGEQK